MPSFTPKSTLLCAAALFALLPRCADAAAASPQTVTAGSLTILHPWARATPGGAKVAAGYVTIKNGGDSPDRLVGAAAEVAGEVSPHEMAMKNGVMTMRPLTAGVPIPAHATVTLAPGGMHLMLEDLKHPLKRGESFAGSFTFDKAGTVPVQFSVEAVGAKAPAAPMDKAMKMN